MDQAKYRALPKETAPPVAASGNRVIRQPSIQQLPSKLATKPKAGQHKAERRKVQGKLAHPKL